jgi:hypothetical protein
LRTISPDMEALPGMRCDLDSSNLAKAMINDSGDAEEDLGLPYAGRGTLLGWVCCEEEAVG